jgi:hypothetical protein
MAALVGGKEGTWELHYRGVRRDEKAALETRKHELQRLH